MAKDQFLAIVSHELRTPLNAIAGWAQLLARFQDDPAMRARAIPIIRRNAEAEGRLIESILDVTRLSGGRERPASVPVDLGQVLRSVLDSFAPATAEKELAVDASLSDPVPSVLGDEHRLRQVFTNLLANSVKFTPAGGCIRVSLDAEGEGVRVQVVDTGVGIPAAFLPHVFEPFRQADSSWTRPHGGLGLGLAIAKSVVELHGGRIEAASAGEGEGATFTVILPRRACIAAGA